MRAGKSPRHSPPYSFIGGRKCRTVWYGSTCIRGWLDLQTKVCTSGTKGELGGWCVKNTVTLPLPLSVRFAPFCTYTPWSPTTHCTCAPGCSHDARTACALDMPGPLAATTTPAPRVLLTCQGPCCCRRCSQPLCVGQPGGDGWWSWYM